MKARYVNALQSNSGDTRDKSGGRALPLKTSVKQIQRRGLEWLYLACQNTGTPFKGKHRVKTSIFWKKDSPISRACPATPEGKKKSESTTAYKQGYPSCIFFRSERQKIFSFTPSLPFSVLMLLLLLNSGACTSPALSCSTERKRS